MTCDTMLQQMLDADLDVLAGRGDSPLARHLHECARCQAVAATLERETRALAAAAARPAARHPALSSLYSPRLRTAAVLTVAVVVIVMASRMGISVAPVSVEDVRSTTSEGPAARIDVPPMTIASTLKRDYAAAQPPGTPNASLVSTSTAVTPTSFEFAPVAATPMPLVGADDVAPAAMAGDSTGVIVAPAPGQRVAVLRTSDPKITVVWIY